MSNGNNETVMVRIDLPKNLHKRVKIGATSEDKTMHDMLVKVIDLGSKYLVSKRASHNIIIAKQPQT